MIPKVIGFTVILIIEKVYCSKIILIRNYAFTLIKLSKRFIFLISWHIQVFVPRARICWIFTRFYVSSKWMILHCKPSVGYRYSINRNQIENLRIQNVPESTRDILKTLDVNQTVAKCFLHTHVTGLLNLHLAHSLTYIIITGRSTDSFMATIALQKLMSGRLNFNVMFWVYFSVKLHSKSISWYFELISTFFSVARLFRDNYYYMKPKQPETKLS